MFLQGYIKGKYCHHCNFSLLLHVCTLCNCVWDNKVINDSLWQPAQQQATWTIGRTTQIQNWGYLQRCLHCCDSGATEWSCLSLISTTVGLANTQEEHTGRQTRSKRKGAVNTEVWRTEKEMTMSSVKTGFSESKVYWVPLQEDSNFHLQPIPMPDADPKYQPQPVTKLRNEISEPKTYSTCFKGLKDPSEHKWTW